MIVSYGNVQVHIVVNAIPNGSRRVKSWQNGLEKRGAAVVQVDRCRLLRV